MKAEPADAVEVLGMYAHEAAMLVWDAVMVWIERLFLEPYLWSCGSRPMPLVVVPGNWLPAMPGRGCQ